MRRFLHTGLVASAKPLLHLVKLLVCRKKYIKNLTQLCLYRRMVSEKKAKNVAIIDKDEKAGATVMVTSTAVGNLLGFQMIADGNCHQALDKFLSRRTDYEPKHGGVHKTLAGGEKSKHEFFNFKKTISSKGE